MSANANCTTSISYTVPSKVLQTSSSNAVVSHCFVQMLDLWAAQAHSGPHDPTQSQQSMGPGGMMQPQGGMGRGPGRGRGGGRGRGRGMGPGMMGRGGMGPGGGMMGPGGMGFDPRRGRGRGRGRGLGNGTGMPRAPKGRRAPSKHMVNHTMANRGGAGGRGLMSAMPPPGAKGQPPLPGMRTRGAKGKRLKPKRSKKMKQADNTPPTQPIPIAPEVIKQAADAVSFSLVPGWYVVRSLDFSCCCTVQ